MQNLGLVAYRFRADEKEIGIINTNLNGGEKFLHRFYFGDIRKRGTL